VFIILVATDFYRCFPDYFSQSPSILLYLMSPLLVAHSHWGIDDVGSQNIEAYKFEHASMNRLQNAKDVSVEAICGVGFRRATRCQGKKSLLSFKHACFINSASAVGAAHRKDTIDPALENGGKTEPPAGRSG
jgi:hypothetical protein